MTLRTKPPFRADHVGSLLRPRALKDARDLLLGEQTAQDHLGPHFNLDLADIEDRHVREVVALQERVGLRLATDGEFRRRSWWLELIMTWDGFTANRQSASSPFKWRNENGPQQDFSSLWIDQRISWRRSAVAKALEFLAETTSDGVTAKVTIPAPQVVHCFMGGDKAVRDSWYGDVDAFWNDLVAAYRKELDTLVEAGATYIQLDDTAIAFLCDPLLQDVVRGLGQEPEEALKEYARRINQVVAGLPDDVTVTLHQCRGNREGLWAAEGGYDFVAEIMFNEIDVDGYFLEYDTERAGGFEPLRFVPDGKVVALGLVSTKTPELESADALKRRIEQAAKFTPIDRLALTTQCGFASSIKGNPMTEAEQEAKLARIVEVAHDVWEDA
ncbi:MAG: 5-methyltetrahydropteroyltriglutamate--homocysteine S-methyltransferase [Pseudomonadota bacterium]|nr:5-methyltetrahydropteroyltriglutamate--homocysteine S-methyltransferase [Pseudomonadota bacterium]